MKKPALIIQELSIYKMPGFPSGMESITSLASHINVIAGPNASGKSSTARIIQDLIWKKNIDRIHVQSRIAVEDENWDIHIDNGHYSSQCDGVDANLTSLPAYDESKRYFLALHELIKEDDKNLAEEILRETIGGYDLKKAQSSLGFKGNTPNLGLAEYKDFESKRKEVDEIEKKQVKLQGDDIKLSTLKENYDKAKKASHITQFYASLSEFLQTKKEYEDLAIKKSFYPDEMALLNGNEDTLSSKLEKQIEDSTQNIEGIIRERKVNEEELLALPLPKEGYDRVLLNELNEHLDKLATLERNLESKRIILKKDEAKTEVVLSQLFSTLKSEDLAALDLENIHDLDRFFEEANQVLNKKQALETEIQGLREEVQEQDASEENLHNGIRLLLNWFEKDGSEAGISQLTLWVLLLLGTISVFLSYFLGWMGFIGLFVMLIYIVLKGRGGNSDSLRKTRVSDFKRTGLPEPTAWEEEVVSKRLEELHQELHEVKQQKEIARRLSELNHSLVKLQPEFAALEIKREEWIRKLHSIPELTVQNIESYAGLYWFLKDLQEWQMRRNELRGNQLSFDEEGKCYSETLSRINSILSNVHLGEASDASSAKAILRSMNEDESRRKLYVRDLRNLDQRKGDFEKLKKSGNQELLSLYSMLNLELGEKEKLSELLSNKVAYDQWTKTFEHAQHRLTEKENQIQNHSLYGALIEEIPTMQVEEAEERREHYEILSNQTEVLNTEIATIEALINKEKMGQELEVALAVKESMLDNLEQNYLNTVGSITGDLIIKGLKKKTQEHSKSKVFNRANELFNKITHGHYELILDDHEGGSFRAKDTVLNYSLPLDHLSSGTRIQLLIAVRLAFIESQEDGMKLPILADEVLANSDDLRAKQIIEALIEISKEGRQVFYFTAQTDELKKWQEHIVRHPEINGKIFVLKGQTNAQVSYKLSEQTERPSLSFAKVPSPEYSSSEEYHQLLSPPLYNLLQHTSQQLHLAHLIDDNRLLHACLKHGIQYYGQLKSFVSHQGEIKGLDDAVIAGIDQKVELLDLYQELYRKGRPKPIDREVLVQSGCVSDTFIDAVTAKLKEVDDNPKRLIEALKNREVSGFMRSKIIELEEYFYETEYLDDNEPVSPEELTIQLHATLSRMVLSTKEADRFLKRVVG